MTRLSWGNAGDRHYEAGVDRGVLYVTGKDGVAWNGLISISEAPSGGDPTPYYLDGIKYLNASSAEEFVATLKAFFSPLEFDACDGTIAIHPGLFVTQQPRKSFGLCYRTKVGNDVDGVDHGYKLHFVYGALAAPSSRDNVSLNKSVSPIEFSWNITTTPPSIGMYRSTSHFVIDSTQVSSRRLAYLEDILYGLDNVVSRLISPNDLITLLGEPIEFEIVILENGEYSANGWAVESMENGGFSISHESVIDNGDGSFTIILGESIELEIVILENGKYSANGSAVAIMENDRFSISHERIIDNGDGLFTIT